MSVAERLPELSGVAPFRLDPRINPTNVEDPLLNSVLAPLAKREQGQPPKRIWQADPKLMTSLIDQAQAGIDRIGNQTRQTIKEKDQGEKEGPESEHTRIVLLYFFDIHCIPRLTPEEERTLLRMVWEKNRSEESLPLAGYRALWEKVISIGKEAADCLCKANLTLVTYLARKYKAYTEGLTFLDLVQEGSIGLMQGIEKFDYRKNNCFSTYVDFWIEQAIRRGIDNRAECIRVPVHARQAYWRVFNKIPAEEPLNNESVRQAVKDSRANITEETFWITHWALNTVSLNTKSINRKKRSGDPSLSVDFPFGQVMDRIITGQALSCLTPWQRQVVQLRQEGYTFQEIAKMYGVKRQAVDQAEKRGLSRMGKKILIGPQNLFPKSQNW